MVRERRKSFHEATRRILRSYNLEAQNSQIKKVTKRRKSTTQFVEPARKSRRLQKIDAAPEIDLDNFQRKARSKSQSTLRNRDENGPRENQSNRIETVKAQKITRRRVTVAVERMHETDDSEDDNEDEPLVVSSQPIKSVEPRQIEQITCKQVSVSLQRMNTEALNNWLGIRNVPQRRMTTNDVRLDGYTVRAKECMTRRCTVNLERIDWSRYRMPQTIDEHENEAHAQEPDNNLSMPEPLVPRMSTQDIAIAEPIEAQTAEIPDAMSTMSMMSTVSPFCGFSELQSSEENGPTTAQQVPNQHRAELVEGALNESMENRDGVIQDEMSMFSAVEPFSGFSQQSTENCHHNRAVHQLAFQDAYVRVSDIISSQNRQQEEPVSVQSSPRINLTPAEVISQAIARYGEPLDDNISLARLSLNEIESTYYHGSSQESTHYSPSVLPARRQLIQSSQTDAPIPWMIGPSITNDNCHISASQSMLVEHSRSGKSSLNNSGFVERRKCFMDSPHISFAQFVDYGTSKFAINKFDHGDQKIENHFLSKFCRTHLAALNAQFRGYVYTTEITARLLLKYSSINQYQVITLRYNDRNKIGNVIVTAVEVPKFPGGALFLFQAENKKTIIHVGDHRLPNELELNESLVSNKIDHVRFDESVLASLYYQFPACTDRYMALMDEVNTFVDKNHGLDVVVAIGAFEIGMESLIFELAENFSTRIYMTEERRTFLENMGPVNDPVICRLRTKLADHPEQALIHVLQVDEINAEYLKAYVYRGDENGRLLYHSILGIRPRGCNETLQTVVEGIPKIVDIANPLIGDINEFDRFVKINVEENLREPVRHCERQLIRSK